MSVHRRNNQYTQHNIVVTIRNIFTFLLLVNRKSIMLQQKKSYTTSDIQQQCDSGSLTYWFFPGEANMFGHVRGHPSRRRHREGLRRPPARSRPWRRKRRNQQMVESTRAVRRRTGGRRRCWVVLRPAAAARRRRNAEKLHVTTWIHKSDKGCIKRQARAYTSLHVTQKQTIHNHQWHQNVQTTTLHTHNMTSNRNDKIDVCFARHFTFSNCNAHMPKY